MNPVARLSVYGVGLAAVFAIAFAIGGAVVPESAVARWSPPAADPVDTPAGGLSMEQSGLLLGPVHAPGRTGVDGELSFQVLDRAGDPVTEFVTSHERDLHLMVVRNDGADYRHVHPTLDPASGTWSLPWRWDAAGSYRVFADFVHDAGDDSHPVTVSRTVDVAGSFAPDVRAVSASDSVGGFDLTVTGDLVAGTSSDLVVEVSRDGMPVTNLQPYLGAYGHLVALREGDLAYLHVHADGQEPVAGETSGPEIRFTAHPPTAGRYLLYLDFQVDGQVHTARFVLPAAPGDPTTATPDHGAH